jgi:hypothetical protein
VALLIVLAGISLLAILIVSYVAFTGLNRSSTASYSKTIQAQEIAMGGLQDILGDLHSEISAGSTSGGLTNNGVVAYIPASAATAQPARLGYTAASWTNDYNTAYLAPTLVRVSRASQDGTPTDVYPQPTAATYPGGAFPINRASPASTTNAYNNGLYLSPARWNKTYLLAATTAGVPAPFTNAAPDWVYVTRTGSRVCSPSELASLKPSANLTQNYGTITPGSNPPASPVVGRYAYVIYDEGALLDANAVGSPSTLIAGSPSAPVTSPSVPSYTDPATGLILTLPGKSNLAAADLTQLPGLSGAQTSVVNPFLGWRNSGSTNSIGATGPNFLQISYTYQTNGYVSYASGDNPVLGRQDLINYFTSIDPNINTASATYSKALPYLGTFSRALNEPSCLPETNAPSGGVYNYATNAEVSTASPFSSASPNPNRDIPNVRFTSTGTITHYADNGTSTTYTVTAGAPLVQHRFSLAKLAWLTHTGVASGVSASAVTSCFGLQWNSGASRWDYYGSKSSPPSSIETLDQVAAENREPNFFELLKAGILAGSLGKSPGPSGVTLTPSPSYIEGPNKIEGVMGASFDSYSAVSDLQVMQIGVNIIDQARADNYPSAIFFNYFSAPDTQSQLYETVFGTKNLPYLHRLGVVTAITSGPTSVINPPGPPPYDVISSWLQPELWNPHQDPYSTYPGTAAPTQLRLITLGECYALSTTDAQGSAPQNPGSAINFGTDPTSPTTAGELYFNNSSDFFANPVAVTDTYTSSTPTPTQNVWPTVASGCLINFSNSATGTYAAGKNQFFGVFTGTVQRTPTLVSASTGSVTLQANRVRIIPDPQLTFVLEYYDGTNWLPYTVMSRIAYIGTQSWATGNTYGNPGWKEFAAHVDPRTDRFSVSEGEAQGFSNPAQWPMTTSSKGLSIQWDNITSANNYGSVRFGYPLISSGFTYNPSVSPTVGESAGENQYFNMWAQNLNSPSVVLNPNSSQAYYTDPDGIIRPGDSFCENLASGVGVMLNALANPSGVTSSIATGRRPVILDRPFRSVGELGYVFRDLPFRTLDFWSGSSADATLLDLFSVADEPQVVAGEINPSHAPQPVLAAVLSGATKNESLSPNVCLTAANAQTLATQLSNQLLSGPLRNRADLVPNLATAIAAQIGSITDLGNKSYGEAPVRALAPVANTRTWNLLIDLIAQAGQMSPSAATLNDFIVQGERRYWLHIAIDRYTGKIIDQQLEPVYE